MAGIDARSNCARATEAYLDDIATPMPKFSYPMTQGYGVATGSNATGLPVS